MWLPPTKYTTPKRLAQLKRDHGGDAYKSWRNYCLERDEYRCQMPGCKNCKGLEIHHIKRFARNPHLKTNTFNGITLCKACHRGIFNKENLYEILFLEIVRGNDELYKKRKPDTNNS
jgi:5-methylcytosine-specific restriction endonuclease McrA